MIGQGTSTPERLDPTAKRKPRDSGEGSFSSPSPVRPPQKPKLDCGTVLDHDYGGDSTGDGENLVSGKVDMVDSKEVSTKESVHLD